MNGTINETGVVPSCLVFGEFTQFRIINTDFLTHKDRINGIKTADAEKNATFAERVHMTALKRDIIPAAD